MVFESRRHGAVELCVISADGTDIRRLTHNLGEESHRRSPDGGTIVFDSNRGGSWNLYLIRPDGTGERQLTHRGSRPTSMFARHLAWSPDGKRILFDSDRDGDEEVPPPGRARSTSWDSTAGDCAD